MNYESAPNCVSYEALLRIIESRSISEEPDEKRRYIVELSSRLVGLTRKTMSEIAENWDNGSQIESAD